MMQRNDIESRNPTPVIKAVELARAVDRPHLGEKSFARGIYINTRVLPETLWQQFIPEPIVIVQIKQRAIHVEEHGIDLCPLNHASSSRVR
jgi:hypothetical protein